MSNEVMSQEEIEKMLAGAGQDAQPEAELADGAQMAEPEIESDPVMQTEEVEPPVQEEIADVPVAEQEEVYEETPLLPDDYLTRNEQDLLGEVGNICMGTSATTMSTLLGRKVTITTPEISIHTMDSLSRMYPAPLVLSEVQYIEGIDGNNLLILKEYDVALITNLMLGDDSEVDPDHIELTEIHMSAIGEVMNQMVGSSATALADLLHERVNISTPITNRLTIKDSISSKSFFSSENEPFVKISFTLDIEDVLTSEIMQVIPVNFAKNMADIVWKQMQIDTGMVDAPAAQPEPAAVSTAPDPAALAQDIMAQQPIYAAQQLPQQMPAQQQMPVQQMPPQQQMQQPAYMQQPAPENSVIMEQQNIRVQAPQFPSFNQVSGTRSIPPLENIEMILDVPMSVTVELGRTKKKIKDILEFNTGSVIVLDRIAGEMVDILVNGKCIGRGEVVVIDDNYGIRITEINMPAATELL